MSLWNSRNSESALRGEDSVTTVRWFRPWVVALVLTVLCGVALAYFNIGLGYNFGPLNSYLVRLGYETLQPPFFGLTADYVLNVRWDISLQVLLRVTDQFLVGPGMFLVRPLSESPLRSDFEAVAVFKPSDLIWLGARIPVTQLDRSIAEVLSLFVRLFVPDPPGVRMRDKLYAEFSFHGQNLKLVVGLLEP